MTERPDTAKVRSALRAVLDAAIDDTTAIELAVLTDEELFAHSGGDDPDAGPYGMWFDGLEPRDRRTAAAGAMRALSSRGEVRTATDGDGGGQVELPGSVVAALTMRSQSPLLSLRVVRPGNDSWYILRHVAEGRYLREIVSALGFHTLSLVRLDDAEREVALASLEAGAGDAAAPEVAVTLTEAQIDGASIGSTSKLNFLDDTVAVGHVVRVPGEDAIGTSMVHVQSDGAVIIGDVVDRTVRYRGATATDLDAAWDRWVLPLRALAAGD